MHRGPVFVRSTITFCRTLTCAASVPVTGPFVFVPRCSKRRGRVVLPLLCLPPRAPAHHPPSDLPVPAPCPLPHCARDGACPVGPLSARGWRGGGLPRAWSPICTHPPPFRCLCVAAAVVAADNHTACGSSDESGSCGSGSNTRSDAAASPPPALVGVSACSPPSAPWRSAPLAPSRPPYPTPTARPQPSAAPSGWRSLSPRPTRKIAGISRVF